MPKKKDALPPPKPPTPSPSPSPRFVRFDFPPGATAEEIAKGIRALAAKHVRRPKP